MITVDSVSTFHQLLGYEKPKHPLITLIDLTRIDPRHEIYSVFFALDFYTISLHDGPDLGVRYGKCRSHLRQGSLVFSAPGQVLASPQQDELAKLGGWALCLHPDLVRRNPLLRQVSEYSSLEYEDNQVLHLAGLEKETVDRIVKNIRTEFSADFDPYSLDLVVANLEMLVRYARRFHAKQYYARTLVDEDTVSKFETLLKERCTVESLERLGTPRVNELAKTMGYSPSYLSDMLKKETGSTAQEYIRSRVLDLAETLLLTTREPIHRIAHELGFEEPSSFTRFVKRQLGTSPDDFRRQHSM